MAQILLLNGPNLNLLGQRETHLYGKRTLADIENELSGLAKEAGHSFGSYQSDAEHELLQRIHGCGDDGTDLILFNPAAFTHTSVALRDALLATGTPFFEVHMSNPAAREPFRRQSFFSDIALGVIAGFGPHSYCLALQAAIQHLAAAAKKQPE
ncbi:MAG: 3-dehydroquinate dehydratase [Gammaproteobacteria bacterium]|nr:3-dehydroquinate dehydratase [Pseudomonadota bacterium]MCZ6537082.1 3-dehydroquinate dehydratase [Gammaproteobacteria bacterium]MCZ6687641.1 3-dehydroquinate dehydratase [Gammaproteobacteria bacterium]MCZ6761600.1 3-dehydroquinate dehydratase [Gammaproteobacteria bacterium]TDJ13268.1 MAG: 3-dehydroquinate dehydratase [Gammaproteobacteria bacterium]